MDDDPSPATPAPTLAELGWTNHFDAQLDQGAELLGVGREGVRDRVGRVQVQHRIDYELLTPEGPRRLPPAARLWRDAELPTELPGVGDWVWIDEARGEIAGVLERSTAFVRRAAGPKAVPQLIAANVDLVVVVTAPDADFSPRRLERYLTAIGQGGARPLIALNKVDVVDDPAPYLARIAELGVDGVPLVALDGTGIDTLRARVPEGVTVALVGSSGVGKSTLTNALVGHDVQAVQQVRRRDQRGQHTTTVRELVRLPGAGLLIDTPGMREFQLWMAPDERLAAFDDVVDLARRCRFSNCRHGTEPGCEVRRAVAAGTLEGERLEAFLQLKQEADDATAGWSQRRSRRGRR